MTDDGVFFSDTFDREGSGTLGGGYDQEPVPWEWWQASSSLTPSATCKVCGNTVTLKSGEYIPYGDPRLCEHWGQQP